jgi:hypothetical protein
MRSIYFLFILLLYIKGFSQSNEQNDFNKLFFCTYIDDSNSIPKESYSLLNSKLAQIVAKQGLGGKVNCNSRFYVTCNVSLIDKELTSTAPTNVVVRANFFFSIHDSVDKVLYSTYNKVLSGVGRSEIKAYNNLISKIPVEEKGLVEFIDIAKSKIIKYYNANCESIIKVSRALKAQGKYDEAIFELTKIPDISFSCYESALVEIEKIYQEKIDRDCLVLLRKANSVWSASPNSHGANIVSEIINEMSPLSICEPDLSSLLHEIKTKLIEYDKREFDFRIKKYNDALLLAKEALRMYNEDKRRQVSIQQLSITADDIVRNMEKDNHSSINSLRKMKILLWSLSASDFINKKSSTSDY